MPNDIAGSKLTGWIIALLGWVGARTIRRLDDLEERMAKVEEWRESVKPKGHICIAGKTTDALPPELGKDK